MLKEPNPIDKHVGSRVRQRRMMCGMSQEVLARGLGITFQQVQKYEKGANRIGASRLQQIATILNAPVSFFFEGTANGAAPEVDDPIATLGCSHDGMALAKAFNRITSARMRRAIVEAAAAYAEAA